MLAGENKLKHWNLSELTLDGQLHLLAKAIFANPPPKGAKETATTQPYITTAIDLLYYLADQGAGSLSPEQRAAADSLPDARRTEAKRLFKDSKVRALDRHTTDTVGTRRPDVVASVLHGKHPNRSLVESVFHILFIGDVKGRGEGADKFDDNEKGHLIEMLVDLIGAQPWRPANRGDGAQQAVGFLVDGHIIQLFRLSLLPTGSFSLEESAELPLAGDGGLVFFALLTADLTGALGYALPSVSVNKQPIRLKALLGRGESALVFEDEDGRVIKIFHNQAQHLQRCQREAQLLQCKEIKALAASGRCPTFVSMAAVDGVANRAIIMTPKGRPFSHTSLETTAAAAALSKVLPPPKPVLLSAAHFDELLTTLERFHKAHVHRDLSHNNIFDMVCSIDV